MTHIPDLNFKRFSYFNFVSKNGTQLDVDVLFFEFVPLKDAIVFRFQCKEKGDQVIKFLKNNELERFEFFRKDKKRFVQLVDSEKVLLTTLGNENFLEMQIW